MAQQKIAVLGGGTGSLSTVFALTDQPGWQDKYDITVYQLGWRLGGKGASGRQKDMGERIEEHGLHIWFGFYENAFNVIQKCYAEVNASGHYPDYPYKSWDQAFEKHSLIGIEEYHDGKWKHWFFPFPENDKVPGQGECGPVLLGCVSKIFSFVIREMEATKEVPPEEILNVRLKHNSLDELASAIEQELPKNVFSIREARKQYGGLALVKSIEQLMGVMGDDPKKYTDSQKSLLNWSVKALLEVIHVLEHGIISRISDSWRRILLLAELGVVTLNGLWQDGFFEHGFAAIPDIDLRQWFKQYGASDALLYSPLTQAVYDLFFSFLNGDPGSDLPPTKGDISARASLHYMMRAVCCYKGAVMWKMKAGMGDIIFTPLYLTLKERGVKFKFFHKITELVPNAAHTDIDEIVLNQQVTLKSSEEYAPLVDVKNLPCWPSLPQYEQIVQGEQLQAQNINLESYWTPWQDVNPGIRLRRGEDFDLVICGISIAALKLISPQLIAQNTKWAAMVNNIQTVPTLAMQTWLQPNLEGLGWTHGSIILDTYVEPFNTWADMSQTLAVEDWSPLGVEPQNVSYFCGPALDPGIPPPDQHNFPAEQTDKIKAQALQWMQNNISYLWPKFEWNMLIDPNNRAGEMRFDAQYWRVNIDPTERYVLAASGTDQYRLTAHESGYENLYLVGDWVNNTFMNIGAIEPTVISGLRASQAIAGYPEKIICVAS